MALSKKALCRIVLKSPDGKKQFFSGTVYRDSVYSSVDVVIDHVKRVLEE